MTDLRKQRAPSPMSRGQFLNLLRGGSVLLGGAMLGVSMGGCGDDADDDGAGGTAGSGGSGGTAGGGNGGTAGSSAGTGGTGATGGSGGGGGEACDASIVGNHGHALVVSEEDIAAGVDKTYDITAGALHSHSVTVTAADFAKLANGESVTVMSTETAAHNHSINVSCA